MSEHLVESILDKNYVLSENILRERLNAIMEKKLYEKKRMVAAEMNEALGGLTKKEIEDRKKAGYKKASEVLGDPSAKDLKPLGHKFKKVKRKFEEAVEVQPDPEGRITGGKSKTSKAQPLLRKIAAKAIKMGKKAGGAEFRKSYLSTKKDLESGWSSMKAEPQKPARRKAAPETSAPEAETNPKKSFVRRNVNTFLGRDPDYDPKDPRNKSRGGRVGTLARKAGAAVIGDLLGSIPE
jgi:hypothetical protein